MDWNPIASAGTYSAFAAVLAGFVFACIVVVATDHERRSRANTLILFLAAFFCLAVASYTEAVSAGEVVCLRGWTATMFTSGLLGVGAGSVFCGLAWLFSDYTGGQDTQAQNRLVRRFTAACAYCAAAIVVLMLMVTAQGYLRDMAVASAVPGWLGWAVWIYLAVSFAGIAAVGSGWRPRRASQRATPVVVAAVLVLAFALLMLVVLAIVTSQPAAAWQSMSSWVVIVSTTVPLSTSAAVLLVLLDALPRTDANVVAPEPATGG